MNGHWSAVLQLIAAVLCYGLAVGYALGRGRPVHRARHWARTHVAFGGPAGRVKSATVIALLPDVFVPLLWHRIRRGRYPDPPARRTSPVPALVQPHADKTTNGIA